MADDFYSFDEALNELKLKEEELKRLVSEGEIRAFRKGDTMKLRRKDVEELRAELDSDLVDLGEGTDELVFEDETDFGDAGMATQELDVETLVDEPVEELELDEIEETTTRRTTARASRSTTAKAAERGPARGPARGAAPAAAAPVKRTSALAAAKVESPEESTLVKFAMIATGLLLFLAVPVVFSLFTNTPTDIAKTVATIFGNQFDADANPAPVAE